MGQPFLIDAHALTVWQSCPRRAVLEADWQVTRPAPKRLFDALLRRALVELEAGAESGKLGESLATRFMELAASPGLDWPPSIDPFLSAREWCGMLECVIEALGRLALLATRPAQTVELTPDLCWRPLARVDDAGTLHRWITVDALDQDRLARELHGWYVFGDLVACDAPMTLHVIEIGSQRKGRRHSPWCKTFAHPAIAGRYQFRRRGAGDAVSHTVPLRGDWQPVWRQELPNFTPARWVDLMHKEGLLAGEKPVMHHLQVQEVSPAHRERGLQEMAQVGEQMRTVLNGRQGEADRSASHTSTQVPLAPQQSSARPTPLAQSDVRDLPPMSRPACDGWVPCPWQTLCYGPGDTPIAELGLYQPRAAQAGSQLATALSSR